MLPAVYRRRCRAVSILFMCHMPVSAQNLDLLRMPAAGIRTGAAGSGLASVAGVSAFDLNPAGLSHAHSVEIMAGGSIRWSRYNRIDQGDAIKSRLLNWDQWRLTPSAGCVAAAVVPGFVVGAGWMRRINPSSSNKLMAVTGSTLFDQETSGAIDAFVFSIGAEVWDWCSVGATAYLHRGSIRSEIRGDNHGSDAEKWAALESECSGASLRFGLQIMTDGLAAGATVESACDLNVKANTKASADGLYHERFPSYDETVWHLPFMASFGVAVRIAPEWNMTTDIAMQTFKFSPVILTLYVESPAEWRSNTSMRFGLEYLPQKKPYIQVHAGYAMIPQLYSSQILQARDINRVMTVVRTDPVAQVVRHIVSVGPVISANRVRVQPAIEYSWLDWHREIDGSLLTYTEFTESTFSISLTIVTELLH